MQALVAKVFVEDTVLDYVLKIITATRTEAEFKAGVSVRGGLALRIAAQARALLQGRDFVIPDDIQAIAPALLRHRLPLAPGADLEGIDTEQVLTGVLEQVAAPR